MPFFFANPQNCFLIPLSHVFDIDKNASQDTATLAEWREEVRASISICNSIDHSILEMMKE